MPKEKRVVIGADFNGHVGEGNQDDEEVVVGDDVTIRNVEGQMVMEMVDVSTFYEERRTQDYI